MQMSGTLKFFCNMSVQNVFRKSLGERIKAEQDSGVISQSGSALGNMEMTFAINKVSSASSIVQ